MNSLNIDLKPGQLIVMQGEGSMASRTVEVINGDGMYKAKPRYDLLVKNAAGHQVILSGRKIEKMAGGFTAGEVKKDYTCSDCAYWRKGAPIHVPSKCYNEPQPILRSGDLPACRYLKLKT